MKLVIVSLQAPPSGMAGVHRAKHLCNHLSDYGWEPCLIRAEPRFFSEAADPRLSNLLRSDTEIVDSPALPNALTKPFGVGDIGLRASPFLHATIEKAIQKERRHAVFITSAPSYAMLTCRWIREQFNLPVILDFQDPWVSAEGAKRPFWSKGRMAHRLAVALEPRAVRYADFITSVSDRQNDEMAARYPWLDRSRMAAIPIGGDPADFEALRQNPPVNPQVRLELGLIHLSYVGTFLPRAGPLVKALFEALRDLRETAPALAQKLRLNFVGTSNQPSGQSRHLVTPIAVAIGVDDLVREHPARVPFLEALSLLANSNGLLMIGSDEPHYTASKIYPNLMSGTPFLSMFHAASSAHAILSAAGGGLAFAFETLEELAALRPALTEGLLRLATEPASLGRADPAAYEAFTAASVAKRYAEIFERVVADHKAKHR